MMIKLSEVRYLRASILLPVSTEVCPLPTRALTTLTVSEATGGDTGDSEATERTEHEVQASLF